MTQDQHDPTPQTAGSTDSTSASGAANSSNSASGVAPKAAASRPSRRRHTSSRSRQPKDQKDQLKDQKDQKDQEEAGAPEGNQPAAAAETPAALAASAAPAGKLATQGAAAASAVTTPPEATEKPQRAPARTRRGGGSRRRNSKAEASAVQLVPVVSETESAASDTIPTASASSAESPAESLPAPELLPLDKAILAHLDALSQAAGQRADGSGAPSASAEEQPPTAAEQESASATQEETPSSLQRRYRFDRPRTTATAPAPRPERLSGWRATPPTLMTPAPAAETTVERDESQSVADVVSAETAEPEAPVERVEAEEQAIATVPPTAIEAVEEPEAPAAEEHEATAEATEVAEEEEEEQAEPEKTARHRRRRGRSRTGRAQEAETGEVEGAAPPARRATPYAAPESTVTYAHEYDTGNGYMRGIEAEVGYEETGYGPYTPAPRGRAERPSVPATRPQESPWSIANAQQHVQEPESPFVSPEPSFVRGFGPQSAGVASPLHEPAPRIRRGERGTEAPPMSANQLGAVLTNAIAQQTDRLLNELRRQQYPPSMTVALPAFPSTERIGVFVDVANLLYSARSQRMSIDFGRLLDFLRGNRRLIRAHAYAPTNPDPHAEQTFLSAVKGVGYRITTKNYKTFASGARKADMDLDLCMDIVRIVDAGALDTVVLVSGDSDFLPLLEYCSDHGVRVEVAAFDDAAAVILRQSCDLFINLSQVDEIRA